MVSAMNARTRQRLEAANWKAGSAERFLDLSAAERAEVRRRIGSGPTLPPPVGHSSWLAYAAATMDDRSLQNDHDAGFQPQWPKKVTREQMRSAALAELEWIEGIWSEMERVFDGHTETAEIATNPAAMKAIRQHRAGKTKFGKIRDIDIPRK